MDVRYNGTNALDECSETVVPCIPCDIYVRDREFVARMIVIGGRVEPYFGWNVFRWMFGCPIMWKVGVALSVVK